MCLSIIVICQNIKSRRSTHFKSKIFGSLLLPTLPVHINKMPVRNSYPARLGVSRYRRVLQN